MRRLFRQSARRAKTPDNIPGQLSGFFRIWEPKRCAKLPPDQMACSGLSRIGFLRHVPMVMAADLKTPMARGVMLMAMLMTSVAMPAMAQSAAGNADSADTDTVVQQDRLAPAARQAVLLDPQVTEATARACQMAHKLGLTRAFHCLRMTRHDMAY